MNYYVIDEATPNGKHKAEDLYESIDDARAQIETAATDLRLNPEQYEPGNYTFIIREAHRLDDGTIERLETISRHHVVVGRSSGAQ